ncbi:MAG: hypothetical protein JWM67_1092 [Mycobacterium sp.]|jgi:hypothetical protein|nr:hypothetical protein [Mycobacterium sp.]
MRKSTKIVGGVVIAGVVAATGSAFTASNIVPASTAGYGESAVTGASVSNIAYTLATDPSKLASVVFTSTTDVTGKTAQMTLRTVGGVVGTPYPCDLGTYTANAMTITCVTGDTPALAAFTATGLTVSQ